MKQGVCLIGASGSVGRQVLNFLDKHPDKFYLHSVCVRRSVEFLKSAVQKYKPKLAVVTDKEAAKGLALPDDVKLLTGNESLSQAAVSGGADIVAVASGGIDSVDAILKSIQAGKKTAVANKEALVCAGKLITEEAKKFGTKILPIDSEHSAVFQCLDGNQSKDVKRIILTASGGPFYNFKGALEDITPQMALRHPTWSMGQKITIDSATMFNKALELLEARVLFSTDNVDYVIHPTSIVHSMVEYCDGALMAQMSHPSMELPISYALGYPDRLYCGIKPLDLTKIAPLQFFEPDEERFPLPRVAVEAWNKGGLTPTVLVASDEAAVELFLEGKIKFTDIARIICYSLQNLVYNESVTVQNIYNAFTQVKEYIFANYNKIT